MTPRTGIARISKHVVELQHLALLHPLGVVAGEEEVLLDRLLAALGPARLAVEDADDPVAVADGGDLGVGDDDGLVGEVERHLRPSLDPGRAVADDVLELLAQLVQRLADALGVERVLVLGLRGREDVEAVDPLVLDQRLVQADAVIDDVDEVEHHPALATHHEVEVAQADVEIDHDGLLAAHGQSGGDGGSTRGLPDPALARGADDDLRQNASSWILPTRPERASPPAG